MNTHATVSLDDDDGGASDDGSSGTTGGFRKRGEE
jgi:hypothetical protein